MDSTNAEDYTHIKVDADDEGSRIKVHHILQTASVASSVRRIELILDRENDIAESTSYMEKLRSTGLLDIASASILKDDVLCGEDRVTLCAYVALSLPLFDNLTELSFVAYDQEVESVAKIIDLQLQHLCKTGRSWFPLAFSSLRSVRLRWGEWNEGWNSEAFFRLLCLPNLEIFDIQGVDDSHYMDEHRFNRSENQELLEQNLQPIMQRATHPPLQQLLLEGNTSWRTVDYMLSMTSRSLMNFKLHVMGLLEKYRFDLATYRPREVIRVLAERCGQTLEVFEYRTDLEWLGSVLEYEGPFYNDYHYNIDGVYDFSKACMNQEINLSSFSNLAQVKVDAELLLNGYGALTGASHESCSYNIKVDGRIVGQAFGGWGALRQKELRSKRLRGIGKRPSL